MWRLLKEAGSEAEEVEVVVVVLDGIVRALERLPLYYLSSKLYRAA